MNQVVQPQSSEETWLLYMRAHILDYIRYGKQKLKRACLIETIEVCSLRLVLACDASMFKLLREPVRVVHIN